MPSHYKCSKYTLYLDKIVSMLEDPERYGEILRWTRDGRAFKVLDRVRLVTEALPSKGGKVCKYLSFKKQMNNYGFASREDEFFHIHFNRANPQGAKLDYRVCMEDEKANRSKATKEAIAAALEKEKEKPRSLEIKNDYSPLGTAPLEPEKAFAFYHHMNTPSLCALATTAEDDFDWSEPTPFY